MSEQILQPDGTPLALGPGGFVLVSKNMMASVEALPGAITGSRSFGQGLTRQVQDSAAVFELGTVVLQDQYPRRGRDKTVSLYAPAGKSSEGQLLVYADENGAVTLHLPQTEPAAPGGMRAGRRTVRYDVPIREPAKTDDAAPQRGVVGALARKVLKVIGWKVAETAAREVGPPLVRGWEAQHRPMRTLSWPGLFASAAPDREALIPAAPAGQRSLLFIHGTFSRVATAFGDLGRDASFLETIQKRYADRIYGFDHATLASGVATNVMQLYRKLDKGEHTFDIICHSRGGLVARVLRDLSQTQLQQRFWLDAERGQYGDALKGWGEHWRIPDGVMVKVNQILFVATPNSGTTLAQPTHLKKYLDLLMTAANVLPDGFDVGVDAILTTAKLLLGSVMPVLPGLDDQQPKSSLLPLLSAAPAPNDAAIQANYDPPPGLQAVMRLAEGVTDLVFGEEDNDLVVPTEGVSHWMGGTFDDRRLLPFPAARGVHHCNIFSQPAARQRLLAWLAGSG